MVGVQVPAASGAELVSTPVSVDTPVPRSCIARPLSDGNGYAARAATAPDFGWITARLRAPSGDWDLAVFDAANGTRVAGATSFGADEVAQGIAAAGQRLVVQACRRSGAAGRAELSVESTAIRERELVRPSLAIVSTPTPQRKNELLGLGLDVTEHGGPGFLGVVLYGEADALALRKANFAYRTVVQDLARAELRRSAADDRYAGRVRASTLPSGRDTYRRLDDYTEEMKQLVAENPGLVKPLTLPFKTYEGRDVTGIEITENVEARDGKPVFLNMGVHHAREWPSGEHAMEWAYELINGYKAGDERTRRLVQRTRTIIVPIVNPDGFNVSREAGESGGRGGGGENPSGDDTPALVTPYEYHRKNCRVVNPTGDDPERGDCTQQPATGLEQFGVDPNRNYGGFWGGPGASEPGGTPPGDYAQDYRGPGPFSEPETRNIQQLVSTRQITTLITNHTASNLILRPPGIQSLGETVDEARGYKALGDAMAAENGYTSQFGYELYDTTGTTEDWTYSATGGFGFTFEIGCEAKNEETQACDAFYFHPAFEKTVAEYEGTTEEADENGRDGRGNREAYFLAQESTANAARHSVIAGNVPGAAVLRLTKSFKTSTSPVITDGVEGDPILFDDHLETVLDAPGGAFEWHVNPSTRPVVAKATGRPAQGEPSPPIQFSGGVTGTGEPGDDGVAVPAADAESDDPMNYNDHTIVVPPQGNGVDNGKMTVLIEWAAAGSDWDIRLYRDEDANGVPDEPDNPVGKSQQGPTSSEQVTVSESTAASGLRPGNYILRVNNFAAGPEGGYTGTVTFQGPDPPVAAQVESWQLACEFAGRVLTTTQVTIDRGERKEVDLSRCATAIRQDCVGIRGTFRGRRLGQVALRRARGRQRAAFRGKQLRRRRRIDSYCVAGGGTLRIGYRKLRRRQRAVLVLASGRQFPIRGMRVGDRARRVRRRLRGELRLRVGRNVWYLAPGRRARLVFKVRNGRVRELGIADKRLTRTRRGARRFLRTWRL